MMMRQQQQQMQMQQGNYPPPYSQHPTRMRMPFQQGIVGNDQQQFGKFIYNNNNYKN